MISHLSRFCLRCQTNCLLRRETSYFGLKGTNTRNYSIGFESYMNLFMKLNRKIANSEAVNSTKEALIDIHELLHISWSLEIALITTAIRTVITFPLSISQHKILAKYESLKPELNRFGDKLKKEVDSAQYLMHWSPLKAKLMYNLRVYIQVSVLF